MKVKIKGKEYNFEFGSVWGPTYTYETLTQGKLPYNPQLTLCNHIMIYGILVQSNPETVITFDEFILALNDVDLARQMLKYYFDRLAVLTQFQGVKDEEEEPGKKKEPGE